MTMAKPGMGGGVCLPTGTEPASRFSPVRRFLAGRPYPMPVYHRVGRPPLFRETHFSRTEK